MIGPLAGETFRALGAAPVVAIERSRCARHRFARSSCQRCLALCPTGAIRWSDAGLVLDGSSCRHCLLCTAHCPTGALQPAETGWMNIVAALARTARPVLGCRRHPSGAAHVRVECLGMIASSKALLLLDLLFPGLSIALSHCRDCENAAVAGAIRAQHADLVAVGWASRLGFIDSREELDRAVPKFSRRELFNLCKWHAARSAGQAVEQILRPTAPPAYGAKVLPELHALLIRAIDKEPDAGRAAVARRLVASVLTVSGDCNGCGSCVAVCPTGALHAAVTPQAPPASRPERCAACGLCASICRRDAIAVTAPGVLHRAQG